MLLASIDYYRPDSLSEAVAALNETSGARPLAGGQSLISALKLRAASVDLLVDISRLEELRFIDVAGDGSVHIGAGVTYDELATSEALSGVLPKMCEVAADMVDQQVRNRGTLGGNICHNDPINNFPPLVVALGATMHLTGAGGDRDVAADDFFTGFFTSAAEPGEVLRSVTIPPLAEGFRIGWAEVEIGEAAARGVAVVRTDNGSIDDARVVLGCLPVPVRRPAVEEALRGAAADAGTVGEATAAAADGIDWFPEDADASGAYRQAMAPVVAKRAVLDAIGGGHG